VRPAGRVVLLALSAGLAGPPPVRAQAPELRGYYLNVGIGATSGPFADAGVADFQRLRGMLGWTPGPASFDVAYEHTLELGSTDRSAAGLPGLGGTRASGEWVHLQGTIDSSAHAAWRHRIDRAAVRLRLGWAELSVGRQPISWATTLYLTPADPFLPFDPADPFREYRPGVDALRVRAFPGPFTEIDLVLRPASYQDRTTITALARAHSVVGGVEVSGWLGALHDEPAASLAATATWLGAAVRSEVVLRELDGEKRVRFAIGVDRRFAVAGRDLYAVLEYQRDGLGASGPGELVGTLASTPAQRGELLVLGRDALAAQASFQIHPLWTADLLALADLDDSSLLLGPAVTRSVGGETTTRVGVYLGVGADTAADGAPASEFGVVPLVGYLSLTTFF